MEDGNGIALCEVERGERPLSYRMYGTMSSLLPFLAYVVLDLTLMYGYSIYATFTIGTGTCTA